MNARTSIHVYTSTLYICRTRINYCTLIYSGPHTILAEEELILDPDAPDLGLHTGPGRPTGMTPGTADRDTQTDGPPTDHGGCHSTYHTGYSVHMYWRHLFQDIVYRNRSISQLLRPQMALRPRHVHVNTSTEMSCPVYQGRDAFALEFGLPS